MISVFVETKLVDVVCVPLYLSCHKCQFLKTVLATQLVHPKMLPNNVRALQRNSAKGGTPDVTRKNTRAARYPERLSIDGEVVLLVAVHCTAAVSVAALLRPVIVFFAYVSITETRSKNSGLCFGSSIQQSTMIDW